MKSRAGFIARDKRLGYRSRYLLLALAVVTALGVGAAAPAFAAQEQEQTDPPVDGRIVGGDPVPDGKFPFVAALRIKEGDKTFFCGGSLINSSHVLTAAHCLVGSKGTASPGDVGVVVGRTRLSSNQGQERAVKDVSVHPRFNPRTFAYDASMLELDRPGTGIQPIALAQPKTGAKSRGARPR